MKKIHIFNIMAGIIIIVSMVLVISEGSNNIPYFLIILFFISYFMQVRNIVKSVWVMVIGLLVVWSLGSLLPYLFAP
ncbi:MULTISPECIES: hypothetical protein [Priestia]|uniref:hypothetical protein n=1 Tax=Priestia TaxID=2800373 RepID=UPI0006ABC058|nr:MULTISPECIES: hypothetical protein [Priestia]KOP77404.1 hypothetical protein AMS61_25065 [Bacillus sp. FJAT-21351]MDF2013852.1 hypothetical protein [Priestia megaterium]MED4761687.1 hypothetical protein [Priestia megaterium]PFW75816.1 hypothetical protein COL23_13330 [Priestia aryabhattai]